MNYKNICALNYHFDFIMFFTFSNALSLFRGPLALLFLIDNVFYRTIAIVLAMATDCLDGYLARRYRTTSQLGAVLDPLMDKFFVCFAISILMYEHKIKLEAMLALLSRDFAVILFGVYLIVRGAWSNFQFRSIWCGKLTTILQFFVLLGLIFQIKIPIAVYGCFIVLGILALGELYLIERQVVR